MRFGLLTLPLALAGCSPSAEDTPPPASPTWSGDLRAYCVERDRRWLMSIVERIDQALPEGFARGSLSFDRLNLQDRLDGRAGSKELQLRLTALRNGESVALSAFTAIEPDSCATGPFEVIEGANRFEPPLRFEAG